MPTVPLPEQRLMPGRPADLRVNVAPVAPAVDSRGAALARAGQDLQQLGGQVFSFGLEQKKQADQQEAQSAFNKATLAAGERTQRFTSLKGAAATPDEYDQYRKDIAQIYEQQGSQLSAGAVQMYKPHAEGAQTAHVLDGGRHYQQQFEITSGKTWEATVGLAANEVVADPFGHVGAEAMARGLSTIDANPRLSAEEKQARKMAFGTTVTTTVVKNLIDKGDLMGANRAFEGMQASGLVTADAQADLTAQLRKAGQSAEDNAFVTNEIKQVMTKADLSGKYGIRDLTTADLVDQLEVVRGNIENDPSLTQEQKDRRIARFEQKRGDIVSLRRVQMERDTAAIVPTMENTVSLEEADKVIEKAPEWMKPSLERMKLQQFKHLLPSATMTDKEASRLAQSPDAVAQVESAIYYNIRAGTYQSIHHLKQAMASAALPDYSQKRMTEIYEGGGPKGLTTDKVFDVIADMGKVDRKDLKSADTITKLLPVYHFVSNGLPPDKDATPENIRGLLDKYYVQVAYKDIKGKGVMWDEKGVLGEAVNSGRAFVVADPALVALEKNRLKAAGVNPDPTKTVTKTVEPGLLSRMYNDIFNGPLANGPMGRPAKPVRPRVVTEDVSTEAHPDAVETQSIVQRVFEESLGYVPSDYINGEGGTFSLAEAQQRRLQRIADRVKAARAAKEK